MSSTTSNFKKPKAEPSSDDDVMILEKASWTCKFENIEEDVIKEERELALIALAEHRAREVEQIRKRISYYEAQLVEAEQNFNDSKLELSNLYGKKVCMASEGLLKYGSKGNKMSSVESTLTNADRNSSFYHIHSRPELIIPSANPKVLPPSNPIDQGAKSSMHSNNLKEVTLKTANADSSDVEVLEIKGRPKKRKKEQNYHQKELISLVRGSSSPCPIGCHTSNYISSQHKRKLRSIALCPANDQIFVTSALDGTVNLWQIQSQEGCGASLLSMIDCVSPKHKRWPEDIAWHPLGNHVFSVFSADGGDSQVAILNLNKITERGCLSFVDERPHVKGIINSIMFMPWEPSCFVTGGSDHAVICWKEKDGNGSWQPKALHRSLHSSAVMGVAGMQQKQIVLSVGVDKKIIAFDVASQHVDYRHQLDTKCLSILPNPCDLNLFMVHTGTQEKQLRLLDVRVRQSEIHAFGFKQESSDVQSAQINQCWSPDGLYLTSGSVDPIIHIFDIRYNSHCPTQSLRAHQKRVFRAVWHHSLPLLISISSDLHIGLHKLCC